MPPTTHRRLPSLVILITILISLATVASAQEPAKSEPTKKTIQTQKIVEQGVAIEFTAEPLVQNVNSVRAAEDVNIRFKVTDTTTGTPVKGLGLSAWISLREGTKTTELTQCREKIQSYLTGSMRARPDVDLNSYYILALNKSPDISVIDPLLGFGGSKLLTLVMMKSPGEDWLLTGDGELLFVTLPAINQVAVITTRSWKVVSYLDVGVTPTRIAIQPDQHFLWVANDGNEKDGGVTVIEPATLKIAAKIATGAGGHDIVISSDSRFAFVSNHESETLSVIDVQKLQKVSDIKVGSGPASLALSELSKAIYVASEKDGTVTVIDEQTQKVLAQMKTKPGARSVRFAPGGRYGFVVNTKESLVSIFDAASNRMLHEVTVGKAPDQIIFSDTFAFVRSLDTEIVSMLRLGTIDKEIDITDFPGGQIPPRKGSDPVHADSIVLAPEGNSVILANPVDKVLYYYTEGMAAPMGNFQNYRREPLAVLVVDRSLREIKPGVYSTTIKLPASGLYDVAFLNDSPRVSHCFDLSADVNPAMKEEKPVALRIEHQMKELTLPVGKDFTFRFKLTDTATGNPKSDLKDVRVLTFMSAGGWQRRDFATPVGNGMYEIKINVPESGVYMVFFESASMGVKYKDLPYLMLHAVEAVTKASAAAPRQLYSHAVLKKTYVCPMHPEVKSNKPGTCPKCKMDLRLAKPESTTPVAQPAEQTPTYASGRKMSIPDVNVLDQDGRELHFYSDLIKDKTVAINFIFTNCTTICPPLAATFARVQKEMGDKVGKDVHFISISVDPLTDTPERLKAWGAKFKAGAGWTFVTGEKQEMDKLLNALGAAVSKREDHTPAMIIGNDAKGVWTRTYGLAKTGQIVGLILDVMAGKVEETSANQEAKP
ncbi:MAG TPA: SCO family protein [Pyrinomonadaceae bacterium]|nr:SCO family protein [Pyrinomonadaceae bacterium]